MEVDWLAFGEGFLPISIHPRIASEQAARQHLKGARGSRYQPHRAFSKNRESSSNVRRVVSPNDRGATAKAQSPGQRPQRLGRRKPECYVWSWQFLINEYDQLVEKLVRSCCQTDIRLALA